MTENKKPIVTLTVYENNTGHVNDKYDGFWFYFDSMPATLKEKYPPGKHKFYDYSLTFLLGKNHELKEYVF